MLLLMKICILLLLVHNSESFLSNESIQWSTIKNYEFNAKALNFLQRRDFPKLILWCLNNRFIYILIAIIVFTSCPTWLKTTIINYLVLINIVEIDEFIANILKLIQYFNENANKRAISLEFPSIDNEGKNSINF